jgi:hypothetical protein
MGGKALKNVFTRRYLKDEYFELAENLLPMLNEIFKTRTYLIKAFSEKDSGKIKDEFMKKFNNKDEYVYYVLTHTNIDINNDIIHIHEKISKI